MLGAYMLTKIKFSSKHIEVFHNHLRTELQDLLRSEVQEKSAIKWYKVMKISLERLTDNQEMQEIQSYFRCQGFTELIEETNTQHCIKRIFNDQ